MNVCQWHLDDPYDKQAEALAALAGMSTPR